jgi:hypothetical protein
VTSFCQPKSLNCAGFRNITERESPHVRSLANGDLARTQLGFYSGARGVLKVLAYLIEHGDYEELHETIKRYGRQIERFERGVRRRDVIDPDSAKSPCLCHADGGTCRQETARRRRVALRGEMGRLSNVTHPAELTSKASFWLFS